MEMMDVVEFVQNYWIFIAISIVVYFVGKSHGRQDAIDEWHYGQQEMAQQDAFNSYIQGLQQAGGEDE